MSQIPEKNKYSGKPRLETYVMIKFLLIFSFISLLLWQILAFLPALQDLFLGLIRNISSGSIQ